MLAFLPPHMFYFPPFSVSLLKITSVSHVSVNSANATTIRSWLSVADCSSCVIFSWNEVSPPSESIFCYLYIDVCQPKMSRHWNFQFRDPSSGSEKQANRSVCCSLHTGMTPGPKRQCIFQYFHEGNICRSSSLWVLYRMVDFSHHRFDWHFYTDNYLANYRCCLSHVSNFFWPGRTGCRNQSRFHVISMLMWCCYLLLCWNLSCFIGPNIVLTVLFKL